MPDVVRNMHTTSGLLDELAAGVTLEEAEALVLAYIREYVPDGQGAVGGQLRRHRPGLPGPDMPALDAHLHYRIIDVSSIKELARRWYPRVYFTPQPRTAATARWPTSWRASRSCATTAPRCSFPSLARTPHAAKAIASARQRRHPGQRLKPGPDRRADSRRLQLRRPCGAHSERPWWA